MVVRSVAFLTAGFVDGVAGTGVAISAVKAGTWNSITRSGGRGEGLAWRGWRIAVTNNGGTIGAKGQTYHRGRLLEAAAPGLDDGVIRRLLTRGPGHGVARHGLRYALVEGAERSSTPSAGKPAAAVRFL